MGLPWGLTFSFIGTFKKPYPRSYLLFVIRVDNQAFVMNLI